MRGLVAGPRQQVEIVVKRRGGTLSNLFMALAAMSSPVSLSPLRQDETLTLKSYDADDPSSYLQIWRVETGTSSSTATEAHPQ